MSTTFTIITGKARQKEVVDNSYWNYSDYQIKFLEDVAKREGFEHFVTHGHVVHPSDTKPIRKPGPINFLWYENEKLHAVRLGVRCVLCDEIVTG